MKKLFLFIFLLSCTTANLNYNDSNEVLDFSNDLTFNEFNDLLKRYAESSPYPNIDK